MLTWPILVVYGILAVWIFHFIIAFRRQISCMAAMMSAMVLGMTIGLGAGTLLALSFPNQPFQSTISAMMIGGAVGVLAGLPISIMAVLDGLLSGVMGGMMGTMLMSMLPPAYAFVTLRIIIVLCSGILFILFLMLQGEVKPEHLQQKSILLSKPQPLFIFIAAFFLLAQLSTLLPERSQSFAHVPIMSKMNMPMPMHMATKTAKKPDSISSD